MHKNFLSVVGITFLFLGLAIQPSIAINPISSDNKEEEIEPKDYLFQTIIDIANNPEFKILFEQYKYDFFEVEIDRSVYRKLIFRNPRVFHSFIFTKPSMSLEYLNKCYNNGIEVTNVLGENKALEIMKSIEVTNPKLLDELNNIILNDEELSGKLVLLEEMNKGLIYLIYPIICGILLIVTLGAMIPIIIVGSFLYLTYNFFKGILKLIGIDKLFLQIMAVLLYITFILLLLTYNFCFLL